MLEGRETTKVTGEQFVFTINKMKRTMTKLEANGGQAPFICLKGGLSDLTFFFFFVILKRTKDLIY